MCYNHTTMDNRDLNFAVCIRNDGFPMSLDIRKIYRTLPDSEAGKAGQIRIVDESGEDYLYPADYFIPVDLSQQAKDALLALA
jgi:hypothetical protein